MIGKGIEGEELASLNEVKEILEDRKKEKELTYEQQLAYDHAKKFAADAKQEKLRKALVDQGLSDRAAVKAMDIMPKNAMTLKQILSHENKTFSDEEVNAILAVLKGSA